MDDMSSALSCQTLQVSVPYMVPPTPRRKKRTRSTSFTPPAVRVRASFTAASSEGPLTAKPNICLPLRGHLDEQQNDAPQGTVDLQLPPGLRENKRKKLVMSTTGHPACKECAKSGVARAAGFGFQGTGRTHCAKHKQDTMKDLVNKVCIQCGEHQAYYSTGGGRAEFCKGCAPIGYENTRSQVCQAEGCNKKGPNFNFRGLAPKFCGVHKELGMVMVSSKACPCGSGRQKLYGFSRRMTKCALCKDIDMPCVFPDGKMCESCKIKCKHYGFPGEQPRWCSNCSKLGCMYAPRKACTSCRENVPSKKPKWALYGVIANQPQRCQGHKLPGDYLLVKKRCQGCDKATILTEDDRCGECADDPHLKHFLMRGMRQFEVKQHLEELEHLTVSWYDQIVPQCSGSNRFRIDIVLEATDERYCIAVEVDEDQHKSYAPGWDEKRMGLIASCYRNWGQDIFFVRYNPDKYDPPEGERKGKVSHRLERLTKLGQVVRGALRERPLGLFAEDCPATYGIIYLFYDKKYMKWEKRTVLS